jgi:hypothetical protein
VNWTAIGEIIGALAVVVTLIYVAKDRDFGLRCMVGKNCTDYDFDFVAWINGLNGNG